MKQSFVTGLYAHRAARPATTRRRGTDPDADLFTWYALINAGEPYDANPLSPGHRRRDHDPPLVATTSTTPTPPAPLLISNGWTDDLFPADEAIRFYNRTRAQYPDADISLFFLDYGHQRGQNKSRRRRAAASAEQTPGSTTT